MATRDPDATLNKLIALHDEVDATTSILVLRHAKRLRCKRGCCDCCVDGLSVFEVEAERIRRNHATLLETREPHAEGACAFLDADGACVIYEDRPYVCRTQGLPLRWLDTSDKGETVEMRDICPLNNDSDVLVENIPAEDCWTVGPFEYRLSRNQVAHAGAPPRRVELRGLFKKALTPKA